MQYIAQEPQPVRQIAQEPEPLHQIAPEPQPVQPFINPTNTVPNTLLQTIRRPKKIDKEKNDEFINPPSTRPVTFAKAMNAENNSDSDIGWETMTPNLDRTPKLFSDNETDDERTIANPMTSTLKDASVNDELAEKKKKKKEQSNVVNAYYHSRVDNFDRNNEEDRKMYYELLEVYNAIDPDKKADATFDGKPPSKERFKQLQSKLNKYTKSLAETNKLGKSFKKVGTTEKLI